MYRRPLLASSLLVLLVGCGIGTPKAPELTPIVSKDSGLTAADRQILYHLPEGSEAFPLEWVRALESLQTKKPFLFDLERFGFIPDPENAEGLPIGLTVGTSRDLRFSGTQLLGVNCAGCHVNEITYQGQTLRIDGAPGMFDLRGFYADLFQSGIATVKDPQRFLAFFRRLRTRHQPENPAVADGQQGDTKRLLDAAPTLTSPKSNDALEKELAARLIALLKEEDARPALDLGAAPDFAPGDSAADKQWRQSLTDDRASAELKAYVPSAPVKATSPVSKVAAAAVLKQQLIPRFLQDAVITYRLLKARVTFLRRIRGRPDLASTVPGFGRVDAFGVARNVVFDPKDAVPTTSPVSYPHLWGFETVQWLHWDGNSTSVLERNIGQALGLGAVFDPKSYASTVLPRNLHALEQVCKKLEPPRWPQEMFGPVDQARKERGAVLFKENCASCHSTDGGPAADRLFALDQIGTDPARARNFAAPIQGRPFSDDIAGVLTRIKKRAYADHGIDAATASEMEAGREAKWRATGKYAARPLSAAWATAPYLHNGSVPTLYDLLLPASKRPVTFPIGHREYDPKKLGYTATVSGTPRFMFDTRLEGNRNTGHEYGTDLTEEQRLDLLEYLKGS